MSNKRRRLGWKNPTWYLVIFALIGIVVTIILRPWAPSDFSISGSPMQGEVQTGGVIQTTITVEGIHNYEHPVNLTASGHPSDIVVTFDPPFGTAMPTYVSTMTMTVGSSVPTGDYTIIIQGMGADGKGHTCQYILRIASLPPERVVNVSDAFSPLGWMGDWGDIEFDDSCTDNPYSGPTCIGITYSATQSQGKGWAGIYWQYPDGNWGDNPDGRDLTGATKLTFWARGEEGGEEAEFRVGGITGKYPDSIEPPVSTGGVVLSDKWQQYTIDLAGKDLSHIIGGFCWVTNKNQNPYGCTIYLDDIRYEWIV